jgi:hypothetical protein
VRGRKGAGSVGRRRASVETRARLWLWWYGGTTRSSVGGGRGRPYRRRARRGESKASRLRFPQPLNPHVRRPSLGRRAWAGGHRRTNGSDAARSGIGCGFDSPQCARGMGKERPENTICGLERQGAGFWHAAARRRRARRRPARDRVDVPCFERVKLQKIT